MSTLGPPSTGSAIPGSTVAADTARDWQAVRGSADIQFSPLAPAPAPETPDWLKALSRWLEGLLRPLAEAFGTAWPWVEKALIALAGALALYLAWRALGWVQARLRKAGDEPAPDWQPERAAALALLEDADRLAALGRYAEAAHLLLQRSVSHIADARPELLQPATTAREIARLPALPERARAAFAVIAGRVERSLFALRALDREDWQLARDAYADFALAELRA